MPSPIRAQSRSPHAAVQSRPMLRSLVVLVALLGLPDPGTAAEPRFYPQSEQVAGTIYENYMHAGAGPRGWRTTTATSTPPARAAPSR